MSKIAESWNFLYDTFLLWTLHLRWMRLIGKLHDSTLTSKETKQNMNRWRSPYGKFMKNYLRWVFLLCTFWWASCSTRLRSTKHSAADLLILQQCQSSLINYTNETIPAGYAHVSKYDELIRHFNMIIVGRSESFTLHTDWCLIGLLPLARLGKDLQWQPLFFCHRESWLSLCVFAAYCQCTDIDVVFLP